MLQRKDFLHITIFIWVTLFLITLFTTYTVVILFIPKIRVRTSDATYKNYPYHHNWLTNSSYHGSNASVLDIWDIAHFAKVNSPEEYNRILKRIRESSSSKVGGTLTFNQMKDKMDEIRGLGTGNDNNVIYQVPDLVRASAQYNDKECKGRVFPDDLHVIDFTKLSMAIPFLKNYANPCFCQGEDSLACIPLFYVLGAEQCSIDISSVLAVHPLIHSVQKTDWWLDNRLLAETNSSITSLQQYISNYKNAAQHIQHTVIQGSSVHPGILGDASPSMFYDQSPWRLTSKSEAQPKLTVADALHSAVPQAKLIVVLCDPTEHLYEQWLQQQNLSTSHNDTKLFHQLNQALQLFRDCLSDINIPYRDCLYKNLDHPDLRAKSPHWSAIDQLRAGLYFDLLQDWLAILPRRQIHIVNYSDFVHNQIKVVNEVFHFLGIYNLESSKIETVLKELKYLHKDPAEMTEDIRDWLDKFYESQNEELAELLQDARFLWKPEQNKNFL